MAWKVLAPFGGTGELLRVGRLQDIFDDVMLARQPGQSESAPIQGTSLNQMNLVTITSSTFASIGADFNLNLYTSGRRAILQSPILPILAAVTANPATAVIGVSVDGVVDANSIVWLAAPASGVSVGSNMSYQYITPVLSENVHTFSVVARVVSGTSATLSIYYQAADKTIVREL